jgi:CheY-like chemotaxis protein
MPLADLRVLIVEDEALIALMLAEMLKELGCHVVGTAATRSDALQLVEAAHRDMDAATLDLNLGGESGRDVAALLGEHGIPFLVTTGYDDPIHLAGFEQHPLLQKPFVLEDLKQALHSLALRN